MSNDWYELGKDNIWYPYTQMQNMQEPIKVVSSKGCKLELEDGSELIDGISSWWSACHGYNHPHILKAMQEQLNKLPHVMFAGVAHEQSYKLANRLAAITGLDKVFFTDSGSTAVETAMKIAVQYWHNKGDKRKNKFISFHNGYHGDTMGAMSLCDQESGMHKSFNNYMPKQYNVPIPIDEYGFAEFEDLVKDLNSNIAGVIIEPLIQGAGGMKFYSADILAEIYRIAKKYDLIFIADEIMTGFGRTGNMFACDEASIKPDIMCLGKGLTGGVITLAACVTKEYIYDAFLGDELEKALMSGPTFMASPLSCAAANASLDIFEQEDILAKIENIEHILFRELSSLEECQQVIDVRVKGAIGVIQIQADWDLMFKLRKEFVQKNVWLRPFADVIYIMPPFIISEKELMKITEIVHHIVKDHLA